MLADGPQWTAAFRDLLRSEKPVPSQLPFQLHRDHRVDELKEVGRGQIHTYPAQPGRDVSADGFPSLGVMERVY